MTHLRRPRPVGVLAVAAPVLLLAVLAAVVLLFPTAGDARTTSGLRSEIDRARGREQQLSSTVARLEALEGTAAKAVAAAQGRLADVRAQSTAAQSRLARTEGDLRATRAHLVRLRRRLSEGREILAEVLRARYAYEKPDLVEVVLSSRGFSDLVERLNFLKRVQQRDTLIVAGVRDARDQAVGDERRLDRLRTDQQREARRVAAQRDAIESMTAGLEQRRAALASARDARRAALSNTRAGRRRAERSLSRLEAQQRAAARQYTTPAASSGGGGGGGASSGGPWAIPWPIVQCESGGVNHPPNSAGASGYYQFMPQTWQALGGSTPNAYQAPKAEQDRLAAKLWNGGAGAGNWDCAAMVGITG
ncbi:transglycosylase family protein [Patulibacter brassicae]|uniref:Transglycosylase family protein n=1 Tax=Patulibacter brassicae TaxID=1705717 RepID=A0ABU4VK68_9ACTN|nr:transglycosylase family protein [Patulibacter brassicae]MDX8151474.1 transglycosylase family protein [Patulibacter brassicae]